MKIKLIVKIILYTAVFLLLSLTEKFLGLFGFSIGLLFALFYCKENLFVILPAYIFSCLIISFSIPYLICVASVVFIVTIVAFLHYKIKRKVYILENSILLVLCQAPIIVFYSQNLNLIILSVIGMVVAIIFHYICIIIFYPILIRSLKYRLSSKEYLAGAIFIVILSIGIKTVNMFNISIYYFVATFAILVFSNLDKTHLLALSCALGIGGTIATNDLQFTAIVCIMALICLSLSKLPTYLRSIGVIFGFVITSYFLTSTFSLYLLIPPLLGCLIPACIPQKLYKRLCDSKQSYQQKFALRTVVNRDREDISKRLIGISSAFNEMQQLLLNENPSDDSPESLVTAVCENCCFTCPRYARCRDKMGDTAPAISQIVLSALDNGKATLLDSGITLGENCTKLSRVISCANDLVKQYRKMQERKSGIEQGKEMVVAQLGGVSELLLELAQSLNNNLTFDTDLERKLIEELGYANIIASDAVIYTNNDLPKEITLVVRESDADKKALPKIVSDTVCYNMEECSRTKTVKDMISLNYTLSSRFKVLYGESVVSKEMRCGDTRQAIKIGTNKIMFILSDGMGTGISAYNTSSHILMLIETFYKAGFSHKVIFSCVSRLLSLRRKEDFSALDLAVIDTQSGEVDFIKQGGRESYIISDKKLEIIEGDTLPLGIIEDAEPLIERRRLKNNDCLVLVSDGITDVMNANDFATLLSSFASNNPQDIAEGITINTQRLSSGHCDDMTAMVIRLVLK